MSHQLKTNGKWQKLWLRYATDRDVKSDDTRGQNSRFYMLEKRKKERWLKQNGMFIPNYKKVKRDEEADNSSFIKKAIKK